MTLEKGDQVVLNDKHSEFDGETGEVTRVSETMFGDANYTVSFEGGQETGVPEESLEEAAEGDEGDDEAEESEADGDDSADDDSA